jgi:xylulokinase
VGTAHTRDVSVGIDLGTSSLKGLVLSTDGRTIASAERAYPTVRPAPGQAEQNPFDWLVAFREVVRELADDVPSASWSGIALSGMIPTLVTLGERGEPTGPAITWEDVRAEDDARALRDDTGGEELYRRTGQWVDGRYLVPMYRWIERADRERAARTAIVMGAKDYVFGWLTGTPVTDPSTATGFGCFDLVTSDSASALIDERADELGVRRRLAVTLGAADSVCAALGVGATGPGDCAYVWGTSTVIIGVSPELTLDAMHRFLGTPLATGDAFGLEMDLLSTGAALSWLGSLIGAEGSGGVLALAERSSPGADGVTFVPYLAFGEQGALWNPDLRGVIDGLTTAHGKEDVARALVEGIAVESRRCIDVLRENGCAPRTISATGAIAREPFLLRQLADATGTPVTAVDHRSAAAVGAASIASPRVPRGQRATATIDPDLATATFWQERRAAIDAIRDR